MGKIKEKLLNDQSFLEDIKGEYGWDGTDDEYFYNKSKEVSMGELQKNHDDWWNSLTKEQKQKLYEEQEAYEQDRIDNDLNGLNSRYGV